MSIRKALFFISLLVSMVCLAAGYGIARLWIGVAISIFSGFSWLIARKYPGSGLPLICLLVSVCLAVAGQLSGTSAVLMICGAGFALATWDLLFLDDALKNNSLDEQTRRYENRHLQSLGLALGFGLTVVFVGQSLHFSIPFVVMILFVALIMFGFKRIWDAIKKRDKPIP